MLDLLRVEHGYLAAEEHERDEGEEPDLRSAKSSDAHLWLFFQRSHSRSQLESSRHSGTASDRRLAAITAPLLLQLCGELTAFTAYTDCTRTLTRLMPKRRRIKSLSAPPTTRPRQLKIEIVETCVAWSFLTLCGSYFHPSRARASVTA